MLISGISTILADTVKDITDLPPGMAYDSFRTEVLRRNYNTPESRFRSLLQDEHLSDRTPSEVVRWNRELSDATLEDFSLEKKIILLSLTNQSADDIGKYS